MNFGFGRGARMQPETDPISRILSKQQRTWRMKQALTCNDHAKMFLVRARCIDHYLYLRHLAASYYCTAVAEHWRGLAQLSAYSTQTVCCRRCQRLIHTLRFPVGGLNCTAQQYPAMHTRPATASVICFGPAAPPPWSTHSKRLLSETMKASCRPSLTCC